MFYFTHVVFTVVYSLYTPDTILLPITSPTAELFSKFFHRQTEKLSKRVM